MAASTPMRLRMPLDARRGADPRGPAPPAPLRHRPVRLCRERRYGLPVVCPCGLPTSRACRLRPARGRAVAMPRGSVPPPSRCWDRLAVCCLVRRRPRSRSTRRPGVPCVPVRQYLATADPARSLVRTGCRSSPPRRPERAARWCGSCTSYTNRRCPSGESHTTPPARGTTASCPPFSHVPSVLAMRWSADTCPTHVLIFEQEPKDARAAMSVDEGGAGYGG